MDFWICSTCAVERAEQTEVCPICADERQWVPADGQQWTNLNQLGALGYRATMTELEPDLYGITSTPGVGIGQQSKLLVTEEGSLLWDPIGYVDDEIAARVLRHGPVRAIVASHPHMYGAQVAWSRALGDAEVLVSTADAGWVGRQAPVIREWADAFELLPGVTLTQAGGHFPGSTVVHWADGADGKGVLLSSDTIFVNPDNETVSFMRSFPNRLPLSAGVVNRIVGHVDRFDYDRLYGNFADVIHSDGKRVVRRSADRHIGWMSGDFDHLT